MPARTMTAAAPGRTVAGPPPSALPFDAIIAGTGMGGAKSGVNAAGIARPGPAPARGAPFQSGQMGATDPAKCATLLRHGRTGMPVVLVL